LFRFRLSLLGWVSRIQKVFSFCTDIDIVAFAITSAFYQLNPSTGLSTDQYNAYEKFNFVFLPVSLASTPVSTALIVYRIVTMARENGPHLKSTYKTVLEIIVESAALYSAVLLIFIILLARDDFSDDYLQALLVSVTVSHTGLGAI
jgi:hypothetical protein